MKYLLLLTFFFANFVSANEITEAVQKDFNNELNVEQVRYFDARFCENAYPVVSYLVNSVSHRQKIYKPTVVNDKLIKINLGDYGISAEVWDEFADNEPYWKLPEDDLIVKITKSKKPIIRADWFIFNVTKSKHYYKLLGLGELKPLGEFYKAAIPIMSRIVRSRTTVTRETTATGYVWRMMSCKDAKNNFLIEDKPDTTFVIGSMPNGLEYYAIYDENNRLQDMAGVDVAHDDGRPLRAAYSCMKCHDRGVKEFKDFVRSNDLSIAVSDNKEVRKIKDIFGGEMSFKEDIKSYRKSLKATGSNVFVEMNKARNKYSQNMTVDDVAAEWGLEREKLLKILSGSKHIDLIYLYLNGSIARDRYESIVRDYDFVGFPR